MAKDHPIKLGDHTLRAADAEGFRDFHTVWDNAANAELKRRRVNPNVLDPGDVISIPDREPFSATRETNNDTPHRFVLTRPRSILNLKLQTAGFSPRANRAVVTSVTVVVAEKPVIIPPITGALKADGSEQVGSVRPLLEVEIRLLPGTKPQEVEERLLFLVGQLPPLSTRKGQQARLNNLGYLAGFQESDIEQLRWAVEEFQTDHRAEFPRMRRLGLENDGSIDKETVIAIGTTHGDLLPGQEATL
jgi:hypothetical protein